MANQLLENPVIRHTLATIKGDDSYVVVIVN